MPEVSEPVVTAPLTDFQKWSAEPETSIETAEAEAETTETVKPVKAEAAAEAIAETEAVDGDTDDDGKPVSKGVQKRFNKLTRQKAELANRVALLEAQAAERAAPAKVEAKPTPVAVVAPPSNDEPKSEDFESYEKFVKAQVRWELKQEKAAEDAAAAARKQADDAKVQQAAHQERLKAAREKYSDFDELVIDGGVDVPISKAMHEVIVSDEQGPELAYYLAHNLDVAAKIAKLSPFLAAKELGKIAATLETEETPEVKPAAVSRAPKPVKTVTGASTADLGKEPDPKDFTKWNKWKDRQESIAA